MWTIKLNQSLHPLRPTYHICASYPDNSTVFCPFQRNCDRIALFNHVYSRVWHYQRILIYFYSHHQDKDDDPKQQDKNAFQSTILN